MTLCFEYPSVQMKSDTQAYFLSLKLQLSFGVTGAEGKSWS